MNVNEVFLCNFHLFFVDEISDSRKKFPFGPDQFVTLGMGLKAQYLTKDPDVIRNNTNTVSMTDLRVYMSAQFSKKVKSTLNIGRIRTGEWNVLDGIIHIEPQKYLNIWLGRMLTPSDRSNLDGPYYLSTYAFPFVSQYPGSWSGRDEGLAVWGKLENDHFRYVSGVYRGHNWAHYASNAKQNPLFALRVEYNFLDPEPALAYYTASTYYGKADILSIGLAGQYEDNGVGSDRNKGDYKAWNVDGLYEKKIGHDAVYGVYTLEGSYYQYYTNGTKDITVDQKKHFLSNNNIGGINAGTAFLLSTAYLVPYKIGFGRVQPLVRYQKFRFEKNMYGPGNPKKTQLDLGSNYVIDDHNLQLTFDYVRDVAKGEKKIDTFLFGFQFQY